MDPITFTAVEQRTKQCPFCAETIQAAAIKCRFCSEFLNTNKARALERNADSQSGEDTKQAEKILYAGSPSLFGMAGAIIRGLFFIGVGGLLIYYPLENLSIFQPTVRPTPVEYSEPVEAVPESEFAEGPAEEESRFVLTENQAIAFREYRVLTGMVLVGLVLLILMLQAIKLKCIRYKVSAERIEWSRGIFDRRVDNLDMFRVIDMSMRRTLFDCIFGIGTVGLITTDKTDPEFTFEKIRGSRRLYDVIKRASLDADKRNSVIHLE